MVGCFRWRCTQNLQLQGWVRRVSGERDCGEPARLEEGDRLSEGKKGWRVGGEFGVVVTMNVSAVLVAYQELVARCLQHRHADADEVLVVSDLLLFRLY